MQVLRYENGEKYESHYDFFRDSLNVKRGGHRIATVLMYLSNVTKGGETIFPRAEVNNKISILLRLFKIMSMLEKTCLCYFLSFLGWFVSTKR